MNIELNTIITLENGEEYLTVDKVTKDKVDYYIDGGPSKLGIGSTIVKIEDNKPLILREGSISKEQINKNMS